MGLLPALSFLTRFRTGPRTMDEVARSMAAFPLAGAFIGLLIALAASGLARVPLDPLLSAALLLVLLYFLTGIPHFDGLVDFADAVAKKGSAEERLKVLSDPNVGAGGVLAGGLSLLVLWAAAAQAALLSIDPSIALALFIPVEAGAKHSMVFAAALGRPLGRGSGRTFLKEATTGRLVASLTLTAALTLGLWTWTFGANLSSLLPAMALLAAGHFVPKAVVETAHRTLDGVNGDVLGAVNEISRAALLALAVAFL